MEEMESGWAEFRSMCENQENSTPRKSGDQKPWEVFGEMGNKAVKMAIRYGNLGFTVPQG